MKAKKKQMDYKKPCPKAFDDLTPNDIGKRGEKNLAKATGCFLTPGSGCGKMKGDGILDWRCMIEKKTTQKKSFVLKQEILEKLCKQAFDSGKEPMLVIEFELAQLCGEQWAVLPLPRVLELFDKERDSDVQR